MSDKIYRTVTFEIEPSGDCKRCKARDKSYNHCMAFNDFLLANSSHDGNVKYYQLEKCKDYLSQEKAKQETRITFENVSSNILCGGNGERKLLDLTLPITPGNEVQCNTAYCKSGKLRVIVEWEK